MIKCYLKKKTVPIIESPSIGPCTTSYYVLGYTRILSSGFLSMIGTVFLLQVVCTVANASTDIVNSMSSYSQNAAESLDASLLLRCETIPSFPYCSVDGYRKVSVLCDC